MKGGRKNWDEHETKTTNDTPQEGRNNRRTLLITGGKLGCRPDGTEFSTDAVARARIEKPRWKPSEESKSPAAAA